jgi:hypothetical protein
MGRAGRERRLARRGETGAERRLTRRLVRTLIESALRHNARGGQVEALVHDSPPS